MSLIGAEDVEKSGGSVLYIGPNDRITPLARDRAIELGVKIEVGTPTRPSLTPAVRTDRVSATPSRPLATRAPTQVPFQNELYRRSAPVAGSRTGPGGYWHPGGEVRRRGGRVVIVGAGHVGTSTATFVAQSDRFDEVVLVDIAEGLSEGMALDLWHAASLRGFETRIEGTTDIARAGEADYVVITAGRPRKPGMDRSDLVEVNGSIVGPICQEVARTSPGAVVVVVTNPLDEMTHLAWKATGFPDRRVIGMAGVLDSARFCSFAAAELGVRPDEVEALALGSHGGEMVIPLSRCRVSGRPLREIADPATLEDLVKRTRDAGAEIVGHLGTGSAYIGPGASVAQMLITMADGSDAVIPACVRSHGAYGADDVYLGLPVRLGPGGVEEVAQLELEPDEIDALVDAAARIRARLPSGR